MDIYKRIHDILLESLEQVLHNLTVYGWDISDVGGIRNYVDFANILGVDIYETREWNLDELAPYLQSELEDIIADYSDM